MVDCYGLVLHPTGPTHNLGGTLDAIVTHDVSGRPNYVEVEDWRTPGSLTTSCCAGKSASPEMNRLPCLSVPVIGDILINSYFDPYCPRPEDWPSDTDELAVLYADELNSLLDRLLPLRHFVRRQRPSDCWFDKECRDATRSTRRLECAYAAANRRAAVVTSSSSSSSSSP